MPGRKNPPAKWVLPEVVDPPDSICITVPVPNDRQHIGAFWGALYNLTSARFWADDIDHTALAVAKVWQDIYDALNPDSCEIEPPLPVQEWEDILSICESLRFDENGKLQGLCCGEWVDISGQGDTGIGRPGQPGGGAEQPVIDGDPVCYHGNAVASLQWLAPTTVSAGDTLEFSNFQGAAWDGVAPFPLPGRWDCPDGRFFFAGECQDGTTSLDPSDPLPTAPHMSLVAQIAGTWYSALSTITVPGGVSAAQVLVQLNDSAIGDNQGQYGFDLCVQNNQATDYTHIFNFRLSPEGAVTIVHAGWTPDTWGTWTAGSGWTPTNSTAAGTTQHVTNVKLTFPHVTLHSATLLYSLTKGTFIAGLSNWLFLQRSGSDVIGDSRLAISDPDGSANHFDIPEGVYDVDTIDMMVRDAYYGSGADGSSALLQLVVTGPGVDPF